MLRVLVTGDRDWTNGEYIYRVLSTITEWKSDFMVIHGAARGADTCAENVCAVLGIPTQPFPISDEDWRIKGRSAGPQRNVQMLKEGKPNLVIAFHGNIGNSRGTKDMIRKARDNGLDYWVFDGSNEQLSWLPHTHLYTLYAWVKNHEEEIVKCH